MGITKRRRAAQWALIIVMLAGCGSVDVRYPDGQHKRMRKAEFKAYAERVFRYQNRIVDRLIEADSGADDGQSDTRLLAAEDAMEEACRALIALVSAKSERRAMALADKLHMPSAVPACERAVVAVDALLPATARH